MRFNFFSVILSLMILTGISKIALLFDRVMINYANIKTNASTIFSIQTAKATSHDEKKQDLKLEKIITEAKQEKTNSIEDEKKKEANRKLEAQYVDNILDMKFTSDEVKLLKELSKRRDELDKYNQQLTLKESVLKATEESLDKKLEDLRAMEDRVNKLLSLLNEKSSLRIKSLAKIYENMKPQEAAKIFEELEMPLLLEIMRNMKEQKVAPIIAQLSPSRAKEVSFEFAKTSDNVTNINSNDKGN